MFPFRRLAVWQRARALTVAVHTATAAQPRDPMVQQMRRAAGSVVANIAEGAGMDSQAQFGRFLGYALASARELEAHLQLAQDIGLLSESPSLALQSELDQVQRMLTGLRLAVMRSQTKAARAHGPRRPESR